MPGKFRVGEPRCGFQHSVPPPTTPTCSMVHQRRTHQEPNRPNANAVPRSLLRDRLPGLQWSLLECWRHGQPRLRQTWDRSLDREPAATHDGERTAWKSLVSSHRTVEPGVPPFETWSTQLVMPVQPASGEVQVSYYFYQHVQFTC